jgi:hypothetical protein
VAAGRGRSRRVSIPGVAELLRPAAPGPVGSDERQATGRERHDQKITVYLSADELLDIEQARLALRRYGLVIDRGRLVREAIAILLADLDARGKDSLVARRVRATVEAGIEATVLNGAALNGAALITPNGSALIAPNGSAAYMPALAARAGEAKADGADDAASPLPSLSW